MDCLIIIIIIICRSRTCGGEDLFENGVNLGVGSRPSDRSKESLDACWFLTNIECIEEYLVVFLHFFLQFIRGTDGGRWMHGRVGRYQQRANDTGQVLYDGL